MLEVLKEAINEWRKNPLELVGDLIGCASLFVMFWVMVILF